jgi:hypothetical protein
MADLRGQNDEEGRLGEVAHAYRSEAPRGDAILVRCVGKSCLPIHHTRRRSGTPVPFASAIKST